MQRSPITANVGGKALQTSKATDAKYAHIIPKTKTAKPLTNL